MRKIHWAMLFVVLNLSHLISASKFKPQDVQTAELIYQHICSFKDGITQREWRREHASASIELFQEGDILSAQSWGYWCLRSSEQIVLDNEKATLHAFFYPPRPPSDYKLPEYDSSEKMLGSSELGLIWISIRKAPAEGIPLAQEISRSYKRRYADAQSSPLAYYNSGFWSAATSWRFGRVTVVSAYSNYDGEVIAFIFSSRSGLDELCDVKAEPSYGNSYSFSRIRDLMKLSKMEDRSQTAIEEILELSDDWQNSIGTNKPILTPCRVVETLGHWITEAMQKPDPQRAAALLASDLVLATIQHAFKISELEEGEEARLELVKLGAHFIRHPILNCMIYSRSWLREAQRRDPDGPVGELCFLILMETGFDPTGTCAETSEKFMAVIENGEKYMRKREGIAHWREIEIMIGDAYRDIVAVAEGLADEYLDPGKYKELARVALPKAIEHYRLGLQNAQTSRQNGMAWSEAWRLMAGLPPISIRYLCIID